MHIIRSADLLDHQLCSYRTSGLSIGFVPTMGALHDGHISLIGEARKNSDITVCSIFVNPTQFNDPGDFEKYPVTIEQDIRLLENAGCDVVYIPGVHEIYPQGTRLQEPYPIGYLETVMEGPFRPGHYQGVCQVVEQLLKQVKPDLLFLGQKDYQQCKVLQWLVAYRQLAVSIRICPTLREPNGLAMSSRNSRLSPESRQKASVIYQTLCQVRDTLRPGPTGSFREKAVQILQTAGLRVDYVEIATRQDLKLVDIWDGKQPLVILAAAFLDDVRLIDNVLLEEHPRN